jgi:hypothetical protein
MPNRSDSVTSSRFERRLPGGRHDLAFKVVFGSTAAAARYFKVSRMQVWRWRHDRSPLPPQVADALASLIRDRMVEVNHAREELQHFLREPPKPRRPLSGCCASYIRKSEMPRF